jgi:hypothetical protein
VLSQSDSLPMGVLEGRARAEKAVSTAADYFRVAGLVRGFKAASVALLSADQRAGRAAQSCYRIDRRMKLLRQPVPGLDCCRR